MQLTEDKGVLTTPVKRNFFRSNIWLRYFLQIVFTAGMYFVLARLSLFLQFQNSNATPVWPPSGFALAIMLLWGYRIAPGILFGAFAANLIIFISNRTVDYPLAILLSFLIGIGNTGEALLGNYLMRRFVPDFKLQKLFTKATHVFYFSVIAALIPFVSSITGSLVILISGIISASQYLIVLATWWLGDFSGILLITSFMLLWVSYFSKSDPPPDRNRKSQFESVLLCILLIVVTGTVFNNWFFPYSVFNFPFWIIPFFAWAALRFDQRLTITAIVISSMMAIFGTVNHEGPFGNLPLNEALISLQAFISIMVLTKLSMSISVAERRETESILRGTGSELEQRVKSRTAELIEREREIREQKAFAELLIENSPYMVLAYDKGLMVTAWNRKSEEHTGLKKQDVIGQHIFELFPHYKNDQWLSQINQVLNEGKSLHFQKVRFLHNQGWGESFLTPLLNGDNEIVGVLCITRDISQLVQMTRDLEQKNLDLQKTNEELSSFAYVASHDLQEPLRKIQMFSKRIIDTEHDQLSTNSKDYFTRMKNAAARMQQLIEDLITYSRTGNMEGSFESIHLSQIVEETKEYLRDEIIQKKAIIEAEDLCDCVVIPFQFRQLLFNLFSNSLKFTKPNERPHIIVKSRIAKGAALNLKDLDPQKEYCHISIADNGIGFDRGFNSKIFGLFQRLHGKTEYPGTGIGLAICKKIVENHYGIITAEGMPGEGATFHIYIPHAPST